MEENVPSSRWIIYISSAALHGSGVAHNMAPVLANGADRQQQGKEREDSSFEARIAVLTLRQLHHTWALRFVCTVDSLRSKS